MIRRWGRGGFLRGLWGGSNGGRLRAETGRPGDKGTRRAGENWERGRLGVGYVSGDFRGHPVGRFMEPILAGHGRDRFEVFCYSNNPVNDEVTGKLRGLADGWREILNRPDGEVVQTIAGDGRSEERRV